MGTLFGPKMLRLSGEIANGTVLSVAAGHDYVRWARERIDEGQQAGDGPGLIRAALSIQVSRRAAAAMPTGIPARTASSTE